MIYLRPSNLLRRQQTHRLVSAIIQNEQILWHNNEIWSIDRINSWIFRDQPQDLFSSILRHLENPPWMQLANEWRYCVRLAWAAEEEEVNFLNSSSSNMIVKVIFMQNITLIGDATWKWWRRTTTDEDIYVDGTPAPHIYYLHGASRTRLLQVPICRHILWLYDVVLLLCSVRGDSRLKSPIGQKTRHAEINEPARKFYYLWLSSDWLIIIIQQHGRRHSYSGIRRADRDARLTGYVMASKCQ